jgi:glutamate synthase (NADPH/NADH) small chain
MPELPPDVRRHSFAEGSLGYSLEQARQEAQRCLECKNAPCQKGCPVGVAIRDFLAAIAEGRIADAAATIKQTNALPAVCGRVCPQENQCEGSCTLGKKFEPVAIGRLERFAADYLRSEGTAQPLPNAPPTGKRVAVIGSGPAGLTIAGDLARRGHAVTIFEAFQKPGGVLMYGIPEFRLPKEIVEREVDDLVRLGVELRINCIVGESVTVDSLLHEQKFDAVFVGIGAGQPMRLGVPGEELAGIYTAAEYLTRVNLMQVHLFPQCEKSAICGSRVCILGGGNVAMDAARTAVRLGADEVKIVYRRSRTEIPACAEEVHGAEEEGVVFELLTAPIGFEGDERHHVQRMLCERMELGEPDDSGRRRPRPIAGSAFAMETDLVIVAIGYSADPLVARSTPDLAVNRWGFIQADERGRTNKRGVWSGGDIVTGAATVIQAMGAGRRAASDMHEWLASGGEVW